MKNFYLKFINGQLNSGKTLIVLVFLALWMYLPTLGISELKSWDEAIYANISRTIFQSGDYLHLQFHDEPYFNKPPLFFYLTSWGYHVFGVNEFSSRIVSVLFGMGCLLVGFHFATKLYNTKIATIAVLLMLSNYHFFITVRHGRMESMAAFFIVFACYSFYRLMDDRRWIYGFAMAIGLGVLTKGGMGFLPFLVILPFLFLYPKWLKNILNYHTLLAIVLTLVIVVPWYLVQYQIYGANYVDQFIGFQLIDRMKVAIEGHQEPWWYYLYRTTFYYFSNWSVLVLPGLVFIVWKSFKDKNPGTVLIALLSWCVLLLFSFGVKTKLPWYIFTLYIPLSIAVSLMIDLFKGRLEWLKNFIVITSLLSILILPLFKFKTSHNNLKSMLSVFEKEFNENSEVFAYNIDYQSLKFYTNANLKVFSAFEDINNLQFEGNSYLVLKKMDFRLLKHPEDYLVLDENQNYIFLKQK